jgi:hypothetical protein
MPELIRLSQATQRLNGLLLSKLTYNRLYLAVLAGTVPAVRVGKGWQVDCADLPAMAAYFAEHPAGRARRAGK